MVAVDLFGLPHSFSEVKQICDENSLYLIQDAAQSFGAIYEGKRVGSYAHVTTTSFFPAKPLGCYGDGGAILSNDEELISNVNSIKLHGKGSSKYDHVQLGLNSRLDTIQAAILLEKISIFQEEIELRNLVAKLYLDNMPDEFIAPQIPEGSTSTWAQFTLQHYDRNKILKTLNHANVPHAIYYPKALHHQVAFKDEFRVKDLSNSEALPEICFSLPMHPYLTKGEVLGISNVLKDSIE